MNSNNPLVKLRESVDGFLQKQVAKVRPQFHEGGKFAKLHYVFDGFETFLYAPSSTTKASGTHIKDGLDLKRTMFTVIIAMVPALLFGMWNVGHQHYLAIGEYAGLGDGFLLKFWFGLLETVPIIVVSYGVGLGIEFIFCSLRGHPISEGFLVSGMLIPLIMPPTIPLWMVAVATAFAVVLGKEAFGGTGMNILNVALTARVFIFFAYPVFISGDMVWIDLAGAAPALDGYSGATPLGLAAASGFEAIQAGTHVSYDFWNMFFGFMPGSIGETSGLAILIGAAILIFTRIGSWRIMAGVVIGTAIMGLLLNFIYSMGWSTNPFLSVPVHYHFVMGSMLFAAVFMATDPVTATQTRRGKWIYGIMIGLLGMVIRVLNPAYPEGWMLAILLMNVFAPTVDHYIVQANIKRRLSRA